MHPAVLLTVLLALREQQPLAAFVAAGSSFLYPPAALLAVGMLLVSAVAWRMGGHASIAEGPVLQRSPSS